MRVGDTVLTRDESNPDAPPAMGTVTAVSCRPVSELRLLGLVDDEGNVEMLKTTAQHPFYVEGTGWVNATDLAVGMLVLTADGTAATVVSAVAEALPAPVNVYNLEVDGGHTYYVEDGQGTQTAVWVHNGLCSWGRWLTSKIGGPPAGMVNPHAHHVVYKGLFLLNRKMRAVLRESRTILKEVGINYKKGLENIHWAPNTGHSLENAIKVRDALRQVRGNYGRIADTLKRLAGRWPEL